MESKNSDLLQTKHPSTRFQFINDVSLTVIISTISCPLLISALPNLPNQPPKKNHSAESLDLNINLWCLHHRFRPITSELLQRRLLHEACSPLAPGKIEAALVQLTRKATGLGIRMPFKVVTLSPRIHDILLWYLSQMKVHIPYMDTIDYRYGKSSSDLQR